MMLTKFFLFGKKANGSATIHSQLSAYLLPQKDFLTRMREERLRSERYETPLSLVIIDVNGLIESFVAGGSISGTAFFKHLAAVLRNSTREYDIKGWYQDGQVGILTPNTNEAGARALTRNLSAGLTHRFGSGGGEQDLSRFIRLASLPANGSYLAANGEKKEAKPTPPFARQYRLSFSDPGPSAMRYQSVKGGVAEVAVVSWPMSVELLTQEQVRKLELFLKRAVDIVGALVGIVLFGPLMLLIALLVKLTSPGPVLFRQERLGYLGKPFTFMKFRSMRTHCDPSIHRDYVTKLINGQNKAINKGTDEQPLYKITADPRVTPVGRFLRKTSLDELPQFFNVLMGDMSLIGPRPPIPYECEIYQRWHCRRVLEVKPGITGLWQVSGRSTTSFDEIVRLDLTYVRNWTPWLDAKILLKTFWAVISTKGGY